MMSMTDWIGSPFEISLTAGSRRPSWKISVASVEIEPGDHAADVVPVGDVGRPGDELAVGEHRHREHDVVQVRDAAVERVVGGEDVAAARCRRAWRTSA